KLCASSKTKNTGHGSPTEVASTQVSFKTLLTTNSVTQLSTPARSSTDKFIGRSSSLMGTSSCPQIFTREIRSTYFNAFCAPDTASSDGALPFPLVPLVEGGVTNGAGA